MEGESDKIILSKAIDLFAPKYADKIVVETKSYGGGHSYVVDMLSAWRHVHKHHADRPKAAGLVDGDADGKDAKNQWNKGKDNCLSAKCFILNPPAFARPIKSSGFLIPIVLETLYPRKIWEDELNGGNLETFDYYGVLHEDKKRELAENKDVSVDDLIDESWSIYIKYKFAKNRKVPIAKKITTGSNEELIRKNLVLFEVVVNELITYLFGEEQVG
ncbi:hypothetical protein [Pseudomonas fluorescens]|uniref:hypothetical protein n=1 Tax=Pseudomonas fluorescens TaxID=294 RepID=UPI001115B0E9|nr:hypothetical protein [Pseudomonas fluorescens]